jgi:hypothetical protein
MKVEKELLSLKKGGLSVSEYRDKFIPGMLLERLQMTRKGRNYF